MIRKQLVVMAGGMPAFVLVCFGGLWTPKLLAGVALPQDDAASRLAYAAHWLLAPGLALLVGVIAAGRRGFIPEAIDGTRTPAHHGLEINLRYNQNTLEQTVLVVIAWPLLGLSLPHDRLTLLPAMAAAFLIGRLTFWIGYRIHPLGRAFGMVLTVLPTLAAYAWLVVRFVQT